MKLIYMQIRLLAIFDSRHSSWNRMANGNPDLCHHTGSPGHSELIYGKIIKHHWTRAEIKIDHHRHTFWNIQSWNKKMVISCYFPFRSLHQWCMSPWRPLLRLVSWCLILMSSHYNSFEDQAPVDSIYGCLIFKWVAETWLHDEVPAQWSQHRLPGDMPITTDS